MFVCVLLRKTNTELQTEHMPVEKQTDKHAPLPKKIKG